MHVTGQLSQNLYYPGDKVTCALRFTNESQEPQQIVWSSFQVSFLKLGKRDSVSCMA